jgi:CRISPR-associated protein Cas5d
MKSNPFLLRVMGEYACFTRPELKTERVTYDCMTPSAARGILEAIHWKPAIRWVVDRIHVLKPVQYQNFKINEVRRKASFANAKTAIKTGDTSHVIDDVHKGGRVQRTTMALYDVDYVIEAHFELTNKAGPSENVAKHCDTFRRRALKGQCFKRPCLGLRDFAADFELIDKAPSSPLKGTERPMGVMLYDFDYEKSTPIFFRANMVDGIVDVAASRAEGLLQ